ncbi:MAG TPA: HAD hydrolase-like protein [Anaeromyxobacter sp.]
MTRPILPHEAQGSCAPSDERRRCGRAERGEGSVERAKPAPDLFLECQRRHDVLAEECDVVGDTVWDLLAARRAGCSSPSAGVGVTRREAEARKIPHRPPIRYVRGYADGSGTCAGDSEVALTTRSGPRQTWRPSRSSSLGRRRTARGADPP